MKVMWPVSGSVRTFVSLVPDCLLPSLQPGGSGLCSGQAPGPPIGPGWQEAGRGGHSHYSLRLRGLPFGLRAPPALMPTGLYRPGFRDSLGPPPGPALRVGSPRLLPRPGPEGRGLSLPLPLPGPAAVRPGHQQVALLALCARWSQSPGAVPAWHLIPISSCSPLPRTPPAPGPPAPASPRGEIPSAAAVPGLLCPLLADFQSPHGWTCLKCHFDSVPPLFTSLQGSLCPPAAAGHLSLRGKAFRSQAFRWLTASVLLTAPLSSDPLRGVSPKAPTSVLPPPPYQNIPAPSPIPPALESLRHELVHHHTHSPTAC